ncbi:MAG: quinoprotein dehydrogenase-associated SoxYZ-like carrier [Anderseniella sp.]|nr:quinoprotein dehydrogenase-associated SoxYZ-like carrier [Anderseniella sp.]
MSSSAALSVELTWAELKPSVFGQRLITRNDSVVKLEVPYRAKDDRQVPVSVQASLPNGAKVKSVTIIIDENPMPVSLTVRPEQQRSSVWVSASMRFNGPSPVRAIVEAGNGQLFMSEAMVKTSGLGACAAPPTTTLDVAAKTLGDMRLTQIVAPVNVSTIAKPMMRTKLDISHPNLTGLQLDQITLRYILPRYVEKVAIDQGDEKLMTFEAGISLAENPSIAFDYVSNGAEKMQVEATDTDETVFRHSLQINSGS